MELAWAPLAPPAAVEAVELAPNIPGDVDGAEAAGFPNRLEPPVVAPPVGFGKRLEPD